MLENMRMGSTAIDESIAGKGKNRSDFRPFLPSIYWDHDGHERYLLFLTPIEPDPTLSTLGAPKLDLIRIFEPKPDMVIARTDPAIKERADRFVDAWGAEPRTTMLSIAVELEPTTEEVKGRQKVTGFEVAIREFERRIRDDEGELTEEKELVAAPIVGLIAQSPVNFFNILKNVNDTEFPIHEVPMKVTRHGNGPQTTFNFKGYEDISVDLTNLLENIGNVSYLGDTYGDLTDRISGLDDFTAAIVVGDHLLRKRIEEMADLDIYDELFEGITQTMGYDDKKPTKAAPRTARPQQRRSTPEASPEKQTDKLSELREKASKAKTKVEAES